MNPQNPTNSTPVVGQQVYPNLQTNPYGGNTTPQAATPQAVPVSNARNPKKLILIGLIIASFLMLILLAVVVLLPNMQGDKEIKLTWWGLWEDSNIVTPLIAEYESTHPGVKIEYVKQSQTDYRERLISALSQGAGPDIFRFHSSWVPMFRSELSPMPATTMTPAQFSETYYPSATADLVSGTSVFGMPLEYDGLTLFINTDIFTQAGKAPPTSWDDLKETAKALTIKDERGVITQSGVALGRTENVDHWPEILGLMMFQNRANPARPSGTLGELALGYFTEFSTVDQVWDATLPASTDAFAAGRLAMYFAPSWRAIEIQQKNPNLKFRTIALPQLPKDTPSEPNTAYSAYWAEGVWINSKESEVAWDFLKFMGSRESLEKLYANATASRGFGTVYPRVDMRDMVLEHPVLGSIALLAPEAKSWYLVSRTFDGPTGINSQIQKYYEDAVNAVVAGSDVTRAMATVEAGVAQVLSRYQVSGGAPLQPQN